MNYLKVVLETLERVDPWLRPTLSRNVLLLERLILSAVPELMPARLMETLIDVFSSEFGQRAIDNPWWIKQQLVVEALLMRAWCLLFGMQIICKCGGEEIFILRVGCNFEHNVPDYWLRFLKRQGQSPPVNLSTGLSFCRSCGASQFSNCHGKKHCCPWNIPSNVCPLVNTGDD